MENTRVNTSVRRYIGYIIPRISTFDNAISVNSQRRKTVLEELGYTVDLVQHDKGNFIKTFLSVLHQKNNLRAVIIRIDGSCVLDKYTLLKLFMPDIPFIWEVHGFPEEQLLIANDVRTWWVVWKNTMKRRVLSYLAHTCIFISRDLQSYASKKIHIHNSVVIPNFVLPEEYRHLFHASDAVTEFINKKNCYILWGGDARLPWQAIDTIEQVAKHFYTIDKRVIFIFVGSDGWYPFVPPPNMIVFNPMSHNRFMRLIYHARVCLALYHKPKFFPFYFYPTKILDYLAMGKPTIASDFNTIRSLIDDGKNGFLTDNSVKDISKKILMILRNQRLAKKISVNAKRGTGTHDGSLARKQYASVFRSLVE
jgi:glycosyltransferase involved in cell wall biosynthesis